MTKKCFKCGDEKPLTEFYKHPKMSDGRVNKCKECNKADVRQNRAANIEYYRAYDAKRFRNDPKVLERIRKYQATDVFKAAEKIRKKRYIAENPEKRAVHIILGHAVERGRIEKPKSCSECNVSGVRIHGHHEDYAKPLDVEWLCPKCHYRRHQSTKWREKT